MWVSSQARNPQTRSHCRSFKILYLNDLPFVGSSIYLFTLSTCWKSIFWNATFCFPPLSVLHLCKGRYKNPVFTEVPLSEVSVARGQLWFENIRWKVPEINNSQVLNPTPFQMACWHSVVYRFTLPGTLTVLLCLAFSHCQRKSKSGLKCNHNVVGQVETLLSELTF